MKTRRIEELDFLKCVMITLMVVFHLAYFGDLHPHAKQFVYTFHMPAFLVISGYLLSTGKAPKAFLRSTWWLLMPYAVMEICYATASTMMPVRGGMESFTLLNLLDAVVLHPVGPYWYLHTLILADIVCYGVYNVINRLSRAKDGVSVLLCALVFFVLDHVCGVIATGNAAYFLIGFALKRYGVPFTSFVRASWLAVIPLVAICWLTPTEHLKAFSLLGIITVYLVCSALTAVFSVLGERVRRPLLFIGANTLPILLFSPIFTMAAKALIPFFAFDRTGLLFMLTATAITLAGSLIIAKAMDLIGASPWFCGKRFFLPK